MEYSCYELLLLEQSTTIHPLFSAIQAILPSLIAISIIACSSEYGAGIIAKNKCDVHAHSNTFVNNSAKYGGAVSSDQSIIELTGTNLFQNNSARLGGAVHVKNSSLGISKDGRGAMPHMGTHITENYAQFGGGMYITNNSTAKLTGSITIDNNSELFGGGIFIFNRSILEGTGDIHFMKNHAVDGGGVVQHYNYSRLQLNGSILFNNNNSVLRFGGGISIDSNSSLIGEGIQFLNNNANGCGGGIFCY